MNHPAGIEMKWGHWATFRATTYARRIFILLVDMNLQSGIIWKIWNSELHQNMKLNKIFIDIEDPVLWHRI